MTPVPAAGTLVAVVEKRGRFWAAEPYFPAPRSDGRPARRVRGAHRIVLASNRVDSPDGETANAGDLVLVRLAAGGRGAQRDGRARIVRRIGRPGVARDAIEALLCDRGLARGFEPDVLRAAERAREEGVAGAAREVEQGRRRDLRELATLTIDPLGARDFDDAISARLLGPDGGRREDEGGRTEAPGETAPSGDARDADDVQHADVRNADVRIWVHVADVAAFVPEGSAVDREARRRGTSVYVPGTVEPMLPQSLSNDACSLMPGAERAAITVELDLRGAEVVRSACYRSLICSDARLDYDRVDRVFAGAERAEEPWAAVLDAARSASAALARARERAGGLVLDAEEPEVVFDAAGNVAEIRACPQTESHRLVEHLMIAANEAVARRLAERGAPCLYRVHERPEPARVARLVEQLASLGVPTPPVPDALSPSQAAELMLEASRCVERHVDLALRRADRVEAGPWGGRVALRTLILRTLRQACYSPRNIGHAGLRSACYCHFTSPIRRYPDLVCHRALISTLDGEQPGPRGSELGELGEWASEREREAMGIERDGDDLTRCYALEQTLYETGWEQTFTGEVTGLISAGAFVAFGGAGASGSGGVPDAEGPRGPLYEGMLPVRRMRSDGERDWWELNEHETVLRGEGSGRTIRLGDAVDVRVVRVDTVRGRVDLAPAG